METQIEPIKLSRQGLVPVADLVVRTESDNQRALATVERLMCRRRTLEEDALLDILTDLIERFESRTYRGLRYNCTAAETIRFLMEQNGLSQRDLWPLLGGKSHTSEINGKRKVSHRQAGLLGKCFAVSPAIFVDFA